MNLTFKDRLIILNMLPDKGDLTEQLLCKEIREKLDISLEEKNTVELKFDDKKQMISWNPDKASECMLEVNFNDIEANLLKNYVDKLNEDKAIDKDNLELCLAIKKL